MVSSGRRSPLSATREFIEPCPGGNDSTTFFCFEWVDDRVLIEKDIGHRLELCEAALRLAMLAILGPRAINQKKFTQWLTCARALGLDWDAERRTVSILEEKIEKIEKALRRITTLHQKTSVSRLELSKLLGSLRHVCSCVRPAKPFSQRLAALHRRVPRVGTIGLGSEDRLDLQWFEHILLHGRLRGMPLRFFADPQVADVNILMNASDSEICALHPARKLFIQVRFDEAERRMIHAGQFSINVREQLSAVWTVLCWGRDWRPRSADTLTHVKFWIDNRSAVSWCNQLGSRDTLAQELNRVLGAVEAQWSLRVPAQHLPGACNRMADAGSRAGDARFTSVWRELTVGWSQVFVPATIRKVYSTNWSPFSTQPSQSLPGACTLAPGSNGSSSVRRSACLDGFRHATVEHNRYSWLYSPFTAG